MLLTNSELSCIGLVIRAQAYSDSDLILSILTENSGKISAIVRGAKSSKKKKVGTVDLLDLGIFELRKGKASLMSVSHFKPGQSFRKIRLNLNSFICACCWVEAIDHLTLEAHEDSHELFSSTLHFLKELDQDLSARNACRILCSALENALIISGFGSETDNLPLGFKKLQSLIQRVQEISNRQIKSWESVLDIIKSIDSNS